MSPITLLAVTAMVAIAPCALSFSIHPSSKPRRPRSFAAHPRMRSKYYRWNILLCVSSLNSIPDSEGRDRQSQALSKQDEQKYWTLPRLYVGSRHDEPNLPMASGALVPLSPDQTHYLTKVMRIFKKRKNKHVENSDGTTIGRDCIRIFNGENGEWLAKVHAPAEQQNESSNGKGRNRRQNKDVPLLAECILQLRPQPSNEDDGPWILLVPLKATKRMKIVIEKCTELGVGRIVPVASDLMEGGALAALLGSNGNSGGANIDMVYGGHNDSRENDCSDVSFGKLTLQSIEAAEQCERLGVPIITNDVALSQHKSSQDSLWDARAIVKQWCHDWVESNHFNGDGDGGTTNSKSDTEIIRSTPSEKRVLLICRERGSSGGTNDGRARVMPVLQALHASQRVAFLVGPEGGWSVEEEELFDEICSNYNGRDDAPIKCVSLGSSVLRAETASLIAVGAWALSIDE